MTATQRVDPTWISPDPTYRSPIDGQDRGDKSDHPVLDPSLGTS